MVKIFWWLVRIAVFVVLIYSLFFGSLLFLNPIKLGMRIKKGTRSTIYTRNLYNLDPIYDFIDEYMQEAEGFYGLRYTGNVNIYVAQSQSEFQTYLPPWMNGKDIGGLTLPLGNVIYINPEKIKEGKNTEDEYVKHELIEELIAQNSVLVNNIIVDNQHWFGEGIATYYGGPFYYNDNEFRSLMKDRKLIYDEQSSELFTNLDQKDIKFNDTLYRFFIKYLIEQYGVSNFRLFMQRYLDSPGNFKVIFFEVYNKRFKQVVDEFVAVYK